MRLDWWVSSRFGRCSGERDGVVEDGGSPLRCTLSLELESSC